MHAPKRGAPESISTPWLQSTTPVALVKAKANDQRRLALAFVGDINMFSPDSHDPIELVFNQWTKALSSITLPSKDATTAVCQEHPFCHRV